MKFKLQTWFKKVPKIENDACLNCEQPFVGHEKFCSYCGQKNDSKKLYFSTFINNLFSGFLSYDSRLWNTFIPLLTKPGYVSKHYIEGKRTRFVNPFRLYLNVSIIFFLILGISNNMNTENEPTNKLTNATQTIDSLNKANPQLVDSIIKTANKELAKNNVKDSLNNQIINNFSDVVKLVDSVSNKKYNYQIKQHTAQNIDFTNKMNDFQHYYKENPHLNATEALDSLGYENTFWNHFYYQQTINGYKSYEQIKTDGGKSYVKRLFSHLSISLFVFLPIFTLFLWLLYFRRNYTYMEHLVFVFNTQTVFFLLLLFFYLLNFIANLENAAWVFILLFLMYLYKAMRYFYKQSRTKTIVKFILLNCFYLFLGGLGIVIVATISFVTN